MSDDEPTHDADDSDERVTDEMLGLLLERYSDAETVQHQAQMVGVFYKRVREEAGVLESSTGSVHDPALELTQVWMAYMIEGDA